jgi:hypothetical protein
LAFERGSIVKRRLTEWYTWFSWIVGIRWHMGIYVGSGMVVHFNGEKKCMSACVCKEALEAFASGEEVVLHAPPKNGRHAAGVCGEAERLLQEANNCYNNNYCFVFNNCEDFCVACYEVAYA